MRRAVLILLLLPTAAAQPIVSFSVPAQFSGDLDAEGAWVLVYFRDTQASFSLHAESAEHTNHTLTWVTGHVRLPNGDEIRPRVGDRPTARHVASWERLDVDVSFGVGWSSLYVVADRIELSAEALAGAIVAADGGRPEGYLPPDEEAPPHVSRGSGHDVPLGGVAFSATGAGSVPLALRAWGVREVEWQNATTACPRDPCPDGGRYAIVDTQPAQAHRLHFTQIMSSGGKMEGSGRAHAVVAGGVAMDAQVQGSVRLPAAYAVCDCEDPAGAVLAARGTITMANLSLVEPQRAQATLGGNLSMLSFDEQTVDASWSGTPSLIAVAAAGALAPFLAWVFTRIRGSRVLGQPTRRRVYEHVRRHPGIHFRALDEAMDVSRGSIHYSLKVLCGQGLIVARRFLNRTHYFARHDDPGEDWQKWVLLQDDDHGWIHAWVGKNPGATQSEIAAYAEVRGVKRTALQKRLGRLVVADLIRANRIGRTLQYEPAGSARTWNP